MVVDIELGDGTKDVAMSGRKSFRQEPTTKEQLRGPTNVRKFSNLDGATVWKDEQVLARQPGVHNPMLVQKSSALCCLKHDGRLVRLRKTQSCIPCMRQRSLQRALKARRHQQWPGESAEQASLV